ncbi:MAG: hypothetical protein RBS78_07935, partial [Coriobacteriia bacterium]|nr:hypothetical protein [Coriobacteriia bacterium]
MADDGPRYWDDERLEQDEGTLIRTGSEAEGCDPVKDRCAPDEVVEDPIEDRHVPGTVDDLPYDYGVETPPAADQLYELIERPDAQAAWDVGETGPADEGEERPLGKPEERELWSKQRTLIEISDDEEQHYRGLDPVRAEQLHDALAEDAAEPLTEAPEGSCAS